MLVLIHSSQVWHELGELYIEATAAQCISSSCKCLSDTSFTLLHAITPCQAIWSLSLKIYVEFFIGLHPWTHPSICFRSKTHVPEHSNTWIGWKFAKSSLLLWGVDRAQSSFNVPNTFWSVRKKSAGWNDASVVGNGWSVVNFALQVHNSDLRRVAVLHWWLRSQQKVRSPSFSHDYDINIRTICCFSMIFSCSSWSLMYVLHQCSGRKDPVPVLIGLCTYMYINM